MLCARLYSMIDGCSIVRSFRLWVTHAIFLLLSVIGWPCSVKKTNRSPGDSGNRPCPEWIVTAKNRKNKINNPWFMKLEIAVVRNRRVIRLLTFCIKNVATRYTARWIWISLAVLTNGFSNTRNRMVKTQKEKARNLSANRLRGLSCVDYSLKIMIKTSNKDKKKKNTLISSAYSIWSTPVSGRFGFRVRVKERACIRRVYMYNVPNLNLILKLRVCRRSPAAIRAGTRLLYRIKCKKKQKTK